MVDEAYESDDFEQIPDPHTLDRSTSAAVAQSAARQTAISDDEGLDLIRQPPKDGPFNWETWLNVRV